MVTKLPQIARQVQMDLEATFDGDPAAGSREEILFSYPGLFAILVYRVAHELYRLHIPILPRMMSEYAHSHTGIDIHPGAQIGDYFFIDHGTGIVVGETTVIGDRVKLYQGVTLGALSTRDGHHSLPGKRHPTVEDDVTIYSGASILGGDTVIGRGSVVGGNAFLTSSVQKDTRVVIHAPETVFKSRRNEYRQKKGRTSGKRCTSFSILFLHAVTADPAAWPPPRDRLHASRTRTSEPSRPETPSAPACGTSARRRASP